MRNVHVFGDGIDLRFEECHEGQTRVVERAVLVGRSFFGRFGARMFIFGMVRSEHHGIRSRGALKYIEAAWRLGILKKSVHDRYARLDERKRERERLESAAWNAAEYLKQTGLTIPAPLAKALEGMSR